MSELYTCITFLATKNRRSISDGFLLIQGEVEQLCEYIANKNLPADKHILHISYDTMPNSNDTYNK
jgi:hypothetical protein